MSSDLKTIEAFLIILKLNPNRVPSFADLKKAFRDKLNLHPDRAGQDSTETFQEISEAARIVFFFLTDNPGLQPRKSTDECTKILKYFENTSKLSYNSGNVVFHIEDELFDRWMNAFEQKFGHPPEILADECKESYIFKLSNLVVENVPTPGTVTASLWKCL